MARTAFCAFVFVLVVVALPPAFPSQSQVQDAQIEGMVTDTEGNPVANVAVSAVNVGTGGTRETFTRENGSFRLPVLPLGRYSLTAERPGFKRFRRTLIELSAGVSVTVDMVLEPGSPAETVTVEADAPNVDPARMEISRNLHRDELNRLPLVSRNPFNFSLLQPGTTGRSVGNSAALRLSTNGLFRRVGIQIDGGFNNDASVPGFRLTFLSEVFVKEMQLLSSGYSAEFGNTAGSIVNVITPSGNNQFSGSVRVASRPNLLGARPFEFPFPHLDPRVSGWDMSAKFSGPIRGDRWHFYAGYEFESRKIPQLIVVSEQARADLIAAGISSEVFNGANDTDRLGHAIIRSDIMTGKNSRLAVRYSRSTNEFLGALAANQYTINTTERSHDLVGWGQTVAAQFVSAFSDRAFNEFRVQRAERYGDSVANEKTGQGVSANISGVANLGSPTSLGGKDYDQSSTNFQNATTLVLDRDTLKFGGGVNLIRDRQVTAPFSQYTFVSVGSFIRAISGTDPKSYSQYVQSFGKVSNPIDAFSVNLFIQDERRITNRFRVSAGLRYEVFVPPKADPNAPFAPSREFSNDKNNFGPRFGASYVIHDGRFGTIVRGGSGLHYDPPLLRYHRRARLKDGSSNSVTLRFLSTSSGAPEFPNRLSSIPAGAITGLQDVDAVSPNLRTMYAVHSNVQLEQALGKHLSVTVGFLYSFARQIGVYRNINCERTVATLADGRPVFGTPGSPCLNRPYPQYGLVMMVESGANMNYRGVFIRASKRYSSGLGLDISYTYAKAKDNAPEDFANAPVVVSDPTNRHFDYGPAAGDVRHVFRGTALFNPGFRITNSLLSALLNGYQIGTFFMADSGEVQNIVTNLDLNRDGVFGSGGPDRPAGIPRNSLRMPAFFNVDLKVSRSFGLGDNRSVQVFFEASNVLNGKFVSTYNTLIPQGYVSATTGVLRGPLPDFLQSPASWRPSRQVLIGAKVAF